MSAHTQSPATGHECCFFLTEYTINYVHFREAIKLAKALDSAKEGTLERYPKEREVRYRLLMPCMRRCTEKLNTQPFADCKLLTENISKIFKIWETSWPKVGMAKTIHNAAIEGTRKSYPKEMKACCRLCITYTREYTWKALTTVTQEKLSKILSSCIKQCVSLYRHSNVLLF